MPEPEYQREFGCCELSTLTAITFGSAAVDQMRRQLVFESAVAVRTLSEIMTVDPNLAVAIDAVKLDEDLFPFCRQGMVNVLRYQPRPPGNAPPPVPEGAFSLNSPSILQSCGRSSCRHCAVVETRVLRVGRHRRAESANS